MLDNIYVPNASLEYGRGIRARSFFLCVTETAVVLNMMAAPLENHPVPLTLLPQVNKPLLCFFSVPSVLSYQQPNAKKLRRSAQKAKELAAKGVVPRRQKLLLKRAQANRTSKSTATEANNNPQREYYDIWGQEGPYLCPFSLHEYICTQFQVCKLY